MNLGVRECPLTYEKVYKTLMNEVKKAKIGE